MSTKKPVDSIRVRMYRHGFGDCFLLSFLHAEERVFSMLIDCGIKKNTSREECSIEEVIADLKTTLTPVGAKRPHLDVLVATHEHWDHVAYFHPEPKEYFKDFEIGQVWLAWTENPKDQEARTINSRLRQGAAALQMAVTKVAASTTELAGSDRKSATSRERFTRALDDVLGFYGTSLVSSKGIKFKDKSKVSVQTQVAMENLIRLGKKGGGLKYFSPGTTVDAGLIPEGVRVYVLGPPKNSLINKSNPSGGKNKETYMGIDHTGLTSFVDGLLSAAGNADGHSLSSPFAAEVGMDFKAARANPFFRGHPKSAENGAFQGTYFNPDQSYRRIDSSWLDITGQLALQLDGAINNTSLVLAIELADSGKVLLFPGDAQVGSWLSWHDYTWKVEQHGKTQERTAQDLLENTVLYKVSHHGSHNATVKAKGLELMTHPELVAMIPEQEDCYNGILYEPLMDVLKEKCKGRVLVSADVNHPPMEVLKGKRPDGITAKEWKEFRDRVEVSDVFVEYTVK